MKLTILFNFLSIVSLSSSHQLPSKFHQLIHKFYIKKTTKPPKRIDVIKSSIQKYSNVITTDVSTDTELIEAILILHIGTSSLLSLCGKHIVQVIEAVNLIVFFAWRLVAILENDEAIKWMSKYFILHSNLKQMKIPSLSLILSAFSHIQSDHITANLGALACFGPAALSKLGSFWFAQLYSAGALASSINICLWPEYAPNFGLYSNPNVSCVGASGALSAVMIFTCFSLKNASYSMETPSWLKSTVKSKTMKVPLGVMGLLWMSKDVLKMLINSEDGISYTAHAGGFLLGTAFFIAYYIMKLCIYDVLIPLLSSTLRIISQPFIKINRLLKRIFRFK